MKNQAYLGRTYQMAATPSCIELMEDHTYRCVIEADVEIIEKSEYLVVYIYRAKDLLAGDTKAVTRTFLDKTNYITQDLTSQEPKWLTATLRNLLNTHAPYGRKIHVSRESAEYIKDFFEVKNEDVSPLSVIFDHQEHLLRMKMAKKDNTLKRAVDLQMDTIQAPPPDFARWVEESALFKSRYIYYKYAGRVKVTGYCTHCKQDVELRKPKNNVVTECPNCHSTVTLKTEARATNIHDKTTVQLLEYFTGTKQLALRTFAVSKHYGRDYRNPKLNICEYHRTLRPQQKEETNFYYGRFKNRADDVRWNKVVDTHTPRATLYPHNLHEMLELPELKYSGVLELAQSSPDIRFNTNQLIKKNLDGDPIMEKLAKVGLYRLAVEYIESRNGSVRSFEYYSQSTALDTECTKLNDILQVEHDDAKLLIAANISMMGLEIFQTLRSAGKRLSLEELAIIDKLRISKRQLTEQAIGVHVTITKALKYLDSQYQASGKSMTSDYNDYLGMCVELGMNMRLKTVLFPKDLKDSHDVAVGIMNETKTEREAKALATNYAEIGERSLAHDTFYSYQDEKYFVRAAQSGLEIVNEGKALGHCVGSNTYLLNASLGKIAILFIRRCDKPDDSYYTVEMKGARIVQCKTSGNIGVSDKELKRFIEDWQKELERRMAISA